METNLKTAPITVEKDRNAVSLDLMNRMKLFGMASAFNESLSSTFAETMTPDSFLGWLLSREWDYRSAMAIERLIRGAAFRYKAYLEQIDYIWSTCFKWYWKICDGSLMVSIYDCSYIWY